MARFKQPTLQQVKDYFFDRGCRDATQPLRFYAYYESVGWIVGKKKMVSWKAAISGWLIRMKDFNGNVSAPVVKTDTSGKSAQTKKAEEQQIKLAYAKQRVHNK